MTTATGTERSRSRAGETALERYHLDALIGTGGVGVVYRATDTHSGAPVAVKIMREDLLRVRTAAARFLREARIGQTLHHPAVPRVLEAGVDKTGAPVIVMEYIAGRNFGAILASAGPLAVHDALAVGVRVATALDAAHRAGIIHRDIKPENLMLVDGGRIPDDVMVLDFGLAFCLDEPRLSVTHSFVGSLEYMSPEQARGDVVSSASDIYALGATLVHLLTGKTLYEGNYLAQIAGHARGPIPSLRARRPDVPRLVEHYITSMLDKDPARRPVSARDVAESLAELLPARTEAHSRPPPPMAPAPTSSPSAAAAAATGSASATSAPGSASHTGGSSAEARVASGVEPTTDFTPEREELIEQLHTCSSQLHHVTRAAAAAHGKMVAEIVEIGARRMEREILEHEARDFEAQGNAAAVADVRARLAALGDPAEDARREAVLEKTAARLLARAREDEAEILGTIQTLQAQLRTSK